jgi:hypothetical protein
MKRCHVSWDVLAAGYRTHSLQALNRCRLAHNLLFLSNMALACGRHIDLFLLAPPKQDSAKCRSLYKFPNCQPSQADWKLWFKFWTAMTSNAGLLNIPLGEWIHPSHRTWQWFYCEYSDTLFTAMEIQLLRSSAPQRAPGSNRVRSIIKGRTLINSRHTVLRHIYYHCQLVPY